MVVKTTSGIQKKYLFNAAGCAFLLLTAGLAVRSAMFKETMPPCGERYPSAMLFGWQHPSGAPLSAADLQAKLAGRDRGVIENVSFVRVDGAPAPVAMQVKLGRPARRSPDEAQSKSGMGFTWLPRQLASAQVACLSYEVWLPEDFAFGPGGTLPGLFGGEAEQDGDKANSASAFSTRIRWREDAGAEIRAASPDAPGGLPFAIDPDHVRLPRNRWFRIEQEVALNTPGAENGELRVWVDGKLRSEFKKIAFRKEAAARFLGVVADVHYADGEPKGAAAAKDPIVRLSPFELRWR